jgi:hypothetical protein
MLTIRAMTGGAGYALRHLEHSDYYDEHRRVQGEWHGHGALALASGLLQGSQICGPVSKDSPPSLRARLSRRHFLGTCSCSGENAAT